jgi:hypothetical protein
MGGMTKRVPISVRIAEAGKTRIHELASEAAGRVGADPDKVDGEFLRDLIGAAISRPDVVKDAQQRFVARHGKDSL